MDGAGQAYVTGYTGSADFPASLGPAMTPASTAAATPSSSSWTRLAPAWSTPPSLAVANLTWATTSPWTTTARSTSRATTYSADFPASLSPGHDTSFNGGSGDAFAVKLDAAGIVLLYATFLGGSDSDYGNDIAVDDDGEAYVTGETRSADFPASLGPGYDTSFNAGFMGDAFVVKLNVAGTALRYATFLGGSGPDWAPARRGWRRPGLRHGHYRLAGLPGQPRPRLRH